MENTGSKRFALVALLLAFTTVFVGCAQKEPEKQEPADGTEISGGTDAAEEGEEITRMYITVNGNKMEMTLAENASVKALVGLLREGDLTYTADDYGGFEKVGGIGRTLPKNDVKITTEPGDVVLYQGNQICIFVGSNTWSYTQIGKINGYTLSELKTLLGAGEGKVQITLSLN